MDFGGFVMSQLVKEIKDRLSGCLADKSKWAEFHEWFAVAVRDVYEANDTDAEVLCDQIEWAFSDRKRAVMTDLVFEEHLRDLAKSADSAPVLATYTVTTYGAPAAWRSGTSTDVKPAEVSVRFGKPFGIGPSLVYE